MPEQPTYAERTAVAVVAAIEAAAAARTPDPKAVVVWRFDEAPAELRVLSRHGGDEDWLAVRLLRRV